MYNDLPKYNYIHLVNHSNRIILGLFWMVIRYLILSLTKHNQMMKYLLYLIILNHLVGDDKFDDMGIVYNLVSRF